MRRKVRNKIIRDYYDELKPDMEYEKFEQICKTPFIHAKRQMRSKDLPEIRLMYLGKFKVFPNRVVQMLQFTQKQYDEGKIKEKLYDEYMNNLITFVNNNQVMFRKVKKKIEKWIYL